jgi:hypothetical protein
MTKLSIKTRVILVLLAVPSISLYMHSQQIQQKQTQVELRQIAHFTFTVPVDLINLHPDIVEGKVEIRVKDARASQGNRFDSFIREKIPDRERQF